MRQASDRSSVGLWRSMSSDLRAVKYEKAVEGLIKDRDALLSAGWTVPNIDKLTYAANLHSLDLCRIRTSEPNYHFLRADICHRQTPEAAFSDFRSHAVMHLAAEESFRHSILGAPNSFKPTWLAPIRFSRWFAILVQPPRLKRGVTFVSTISLPMRCTARFRREVIFPSRRRTIRGRRIRRVKRRAIISCGPGLKPTGCRINFQLLEQLRSVPFFREAHTAHDLTVNAMKESRSTSTATVRTFVTGFTWRINEGSRSGAHSRATGEQI